MLWLNVGCRALKSAMKYMGKLLLLKREFRSAYGMFVFGLVYVVPIKICPWWVWALITKKWGLTHVEKGSCFMFDFISMATPSCAASVL